MPRPSTPGPDRFGTPFSRLYREHGPMVRGALRQLGVPLASLEDATQDVFVVLHRRAAEFDRERSMKNWLWGIARGVASTYRRGDRRRNRLIGELPRERATESLDRELARGEAVEILDRFLGQLDPDKCAVFVLAEIEGRSGPEISRMLEVNVNTVYARLRSARRCFHDAVAEHRVTDVPPLFASWLPLLGWPRGMAALASSGALAVALALPAMPEAEAPGVVLALATIPDAELAPAAAPPHPPASRSHTRVRIEDREPDVELEIEPDPGLPSLAPGPTSIGREPAPAPAPVRRRARTTRPAPIQPAVHVVEPEPVATPRSPAQQPWGEHIVARAPSITHAPLIEMKSDFVDALVGATAGL